VRRLARQFSAPWVDFVLERREAVPLGRGWQAGAPIESFYVQRRPGGTGTDAAGAVVATVVPLRVCGRRDRGDDIWPRQRSIRNWESSARGAVFVLTILRYNALQQPTASYGEELR
jgi:hypothetical protein